MNIIYQLQYVGSTEWADISLAAYKQFKALGHTVRELVSREEAEKAIDEADEQGFDRGCESRRGR